MMIKPLIGVNKRFSKSVSRKQIEFSIISSDNIVIPTEHPYQESNTPSHAISFSSNRTTELSTGLLQQEKISRR